MKSTIKIDTEQGQPILKIVQPIECVNFTLQNDDYDVRDKLLSEFIQKPSMTDWNGWFRVNTHFTHPFENPTHQITTIAPVEVSELFTLFKHNILNRLVPYNTICAINEGKEKSQGKHDKIIEFFNWLNEQEWATWEEQHPYLEQLPKKTEINLSSLPKRMTIRGVFETRLSDEERFAAFNNTPKYKWDADVESDHQALDVAFDFETSPEGSDYWNKVLERIKL
jgi:hypothetical protein